MEHFCYGPLVHSRGEFRLLHLLPRYQSFGQYLASFTQSCDNHLISCLLEEKSLKDCLKYTALSYAWGDVGRTRQILVNNKLIAITESLEVALRHLQKEWDTLTLWVDAICSNQEDKDEKAQQVQQMTGIYQNAAQVVV